MPCSDGYSLSDEIESVRNRADKVTRLLCELCTKLEREGQELNYFTPELFEWWNKHKIEDAKRND